MTDREYFEKHVYRHYWKLLEYTQVRINDAYEAEDIVAGVMEEAWQRIHKIRTKKYIYRNLTKMVNQRLYAYYRNPAIETTKFEENTADVLDILVEIITKEDLERIKMSFEELDPIYSQVLTLYLIDGISLAHIAAITKTNYNTVRTRKNRAIVELVNKLKKDGRQQDITTLLILALLAGVNI